MSGNNKVAKYKGAIRDLAHKYMGRTVLVVRGYPQGRASNRRDPGSEHPRVLVAGRNWCTNLSIAKSLGMAGYEAEVLRVVQAAPKKNDLKRWLKPEMRSKYVKAFYYMNSMKKSERIVSRLREIADPQRKMLLIPADDLMAYEIDEHYDELKDCYLMPSAGDRAGGIVRLMDKNLQKELAEKAGLPVIKGCVISSETVYDGDDIILPEGINYPCFIKPNISRNSSKKRMKKCCSEEELRVTLEERRGMNYELVIEDYVEIKRELSLLGLSTGDEVICPGYFEAVVEGKGPHRGVALLGRLLPPESAEPLVSKVKDFIKSLDFKGLFDVDLIEASDGTIYFIELNMRYGASGYALTRGGVNLPAMFADYMFDGKPADKDCRPDNEGQLFVSEKVLIDEYSEGLIDRDMVRSLMNEADIHFVKDSDDPRPYRHVKKQYAVAKKIRENYNE